MARPEPHALADYPHTQAVTTRWMDNDAYGHVNNVVYYSYFDTIVNAWLIAKGLLDVEKGHRAYSRSRAARIRRGRHHAR